MFLAPKEIKAIAVLLEEELYKLCASSAPEAPSHESTQYRNNCKLIVLSLKDSSHQVCSDNYSQLHFNIFTSEYLLPAP